MNSRFLTILLLALVLIIRPTQEVSGTYTLPSVSNTQGYVQNLIESYNNLVKLNYNINSPSFQTTEGNFSLYHIVGNNFHVIVMQSSNVSGFVTLNFKAIGGANSPNVTMDYNDTFDRAVTPRVISLQGEYNIERAVTISYTNTITRIDFAFFINSTDITGDYMSNSKNAAEYLYRNDLSRIPQPTILTPQGHDLLADILSFVTSAIVEIFGSIGAFVLVVLILLNPTRREKAVNEIRDLLHIKEKKYPIQKKHKQNRSQNPKN